MAEKQNDIIDLKIAGVVEQLKSMSQKNDIHFENISNSLDGIIKGLGGRVQTLEEKYNNHQLFCAKVQAVKKEQKEAGDRRQKNWNMAIAIAVFLLAVVTFADRKTTAQNKSDLKELKPILMQEIDGKTYIYMRGAYQKVDSNYYKNESDTK